MVPYTLPLLTMRSLALALFRQASIGKAPCFARLRTSLHPFTTPLEAQLVAACVLVLAVLRHRFVSHRWHRRCLVTHLQQRSSLLSLGARLALTTAQAQTLKSAIQRVQQRRCWVEKQTVRSILVWLCRLLPHNIHYPYLS